MKKFFKKEVVESAIHDQIGRIQDDIAGLNMTNTRNARDHKEKERAMNDQIEALQNIIDTLKGEEVELVPPPTPVNRVSLAKGPVLDYLNRIMYEHKNRGRNKMGKAVEEVYEEIGSGLYDAAQEYTVINPIATLNAHLDKRMKKADKKGHGKVYRELGRLKQELNHGKFSDIPMDLVGVDLGQIELHLLSQAPELLGNTPDPTNGGEYITPGNDTPNLDTIKILDWLTEQTPDNVEDWGGDDETIVQFTGRMIERIHMGEFNAEWQPNSPMQNLVYYLQEYEYVSEEAGNLLDDLIKQIQDGKFA